MLIYGKTDIGRHRATNQDEFKICSISENLGFGLVCDGMGGENGGNIASGVASDVISRHLMEHLKPGLNDEDYKNIIVSAVSEGNVAVYDKSLEDKQYIGMGTTVVLAVVSGEKAYIAHVGDSRVYLIRDGKIHQLTKDHSLVQTLLEQGKITPEEVNNHPQKNMITRAIGISCFVDIDYIEVSHIANAALLLCSDGLTNTCDDETIKEIVITENPNEICDRLIDQANENGGLDNITAVVIL